MWYGSVQVLRSRQEDNHRIAHVPDASYGGSVHSHTLNAIKHYERTLHYITIHYAILLELYTTPYGAGDLQFTVLQVSSKVRITSRNPAALLDEGSS